MGYSVEFGPGSWHSRKELPADRQAILMDVIERLAGNPDQFPGRTTPIGRRGNVLLYSHPKPSLMITYERDDNQRVLFLAHYAAPLIQMKPTVFISYSHEDAVWLPKLTKHLGPLHERQLLRVWADTEIRPGDIWLNEIEESLKSALAAVLFVTPNFLQSSFIMNHEVPQLLASAAGQGKCRILWIPVSRTPDVPATISRFQAVISPDKPLDSLPEPEQDRVFSTLCDELLRLDGFA